MTRLSFFLLLAVLASSLYLVNVQYRSRQLYSELDRARSQARSLEAEGERLQVEKRAQAAPLRVETLARNQLHMRSVTPAITDYVTYGAQASLTPSPAPAQRASRAGGPSQ